MIDPTDYSYRAYLEELDRASRQPISPLDAEESACKAAIIAEQKEYHKRAAPWVKKLTDIADIRPMPPLYKRMGEE